MNPPSYTRFTFEVEGTDYNALEAAATLHVLRLIGEASLDATWEITVEPGTDLSTHGDRTWQWKGIVNGRLSEQDTA
jgi:hypothetical protein